MRDVRLGVELVAVVDAALDLTGAEGVEDGGDAVQEGIRLLVLLDAPVQSVECPPTNRLQLRPRERAVMGWTGVGEEPAGTT
jgi:hypothetical protein